VFDALVKFAGQGFEAGGWDIAECPAKELLPKGMVSSFYFGKLLIGVGADFILRAILNFGASGIQFWLGRSAPGNQSRFGDAELARDAGETQAGDAQAEEFVASSGRMHGDDCTVTRLQGYIVK